jgi:hypothetical protein
MHQGDGANATEGCQGVGDSQRENLIFSLKSTMGDSAPTAQHAVSMAKSWAIITLMP